MKKLLIASTAFAMIATLSPARAPDPTAMTGAMTAADRAAPRR